MELHTRQDFTALMFRLLDPLRPLYSQSGARLRIGHTGVTYDKPAIELEGFSRPLWALAPFWLGGGEDAEFERIYQNGLAHGADPAHPDYWGDTGDYDQCFVEMAAIAAAILEVPEKVWTPLADRDKQNLAKWLYSINEHYIPRCNWLFFQVLVNLALDSVGMPTDLDAAARAMDEVDTWYVADGWYSDGAPDVKPQKDYYIPWAIQYYGILYSVFAAGRDPERAARYRERALAFGRQYVHWFDADGAALPFGRSLSYRFAQCAFWSACVWAGLEPLPLPVMKGLIVRNFRWWLQKPIFDRDGLLTVGYCYPNFYMAEQYNAPGSPYWAMKSFLVLALPEDHPFWAAEAAPLDLPAAVTPQYSADLLLHRQRDGQLTAYAAGVVEQNEHGQFAEKYAKFCYNTRFGFSASRSNVQLEQAAPDSMLAFVIDGWVFVRRHCTDFTLEETRLVSKWSPFPGIEVETELVPTETGHLRRHTVASTIDCTAYDCGYAVPRFAPGYAQRADSAAAEAANAVCRCAVAGKGGEGVVIKAFPNTGLYSTNTAIPAVKYHIPAGTTRLETVVDAAYRE